MGDRTLEEFTRKVKGEARRDFPAFYSAAELWEADLMDTVALGRHAMHSLQTLRARFPEEKRELFDRMADSADQFIVHVRDIARLAPAFKALPPDERARMELGLFND